MILIVAYRYDFVLLLSFTNDSTPDLKHQENSFERRHLTQKHAQNILILVATRSLSANPHSFSSLPRDLIHQFVVLDAGICLERNGRYPFFNGWSTYPPSYNPQK